MKILLVTIFLIPHVGGLWKYMQQIKQGLEALGHEVDMVGDRIDCFYVYGDDNRKVFKSHYRPMLESNLPAASPIFSDNWVRHAECERLCLELTLSYLDLEQYDVIHAQDVLAAAAVSRVKPAGIPLITSIHASVALTILDMIQNDQGIKPSSPQLVWNYYKSVENIGGSSSDQVLLASVWLRDVMVSHFALPESRISLIPYAMDILSFEDRLKKEHELTRPVDKKVIICTSRLSYEKGIHVLLEALGKLQTLRQDWECWLVGDGDQRSLYEERVRQLGIVGAVRFWGSRDDVPTLLGLADIFVIPSLMETLSYSVMEAQIAGLPIVSSDAGGLKEAVQHEVNGLLFQSGNDDMLTAHLSLLLEDEAYRGLLGKEARKWALAHRGLDSMVKRVLEVYRKEMSRAQ
ncbi:glycosyltransferase family 4 protein [Paenibacillus lautus]|uniref:glycosyltransferase family 4 protein n=1 Tax=Paenibacillus lautus TaxID=1401 RepID=UPI002DB8B071|nr:glycosyltransferase family 4 protein [Paenibacillus lautus]MEC0308172.1 glycosyltransferase family 4 protein [Paenibacillus lautus]